MLPSGRAKRKDESPDGGGAVISLAEGAWVCKGGGMMKFPRCCVLLAAVVLSGASMLHAQDRPLADPSPELKALDWMIGSWKHEAEGVVLLMECTKGEGGYFLERKFELALGGQPKLVWRQAIGWNPATKQIESWGFGSDGSIETAVWDREGKIWEVERSIIFSDGSKGGALNIVTFLDKDSYIFKSVKRTHGDRILPEIMDIEVDRQK